MIIPGLKSSRIYIVDASDPKKPKLHKTIEGDTIRKKANLSAPHTVHCLADGTIMISMLGDVDGKAPGGFLLLDADFDALRPLGKRRERDEIQLRFLVSTAPQRHGAGVRASGPHRKTYGGAGFDPKDVTDGKYGPRAPALLGLESSENRAEIHRPGRRR